MHYLDNDIGYYATLNPIHNVIHPTEKFIFKYLDNLYKTFLENKELLLEKNIQFEHLDDIYILNKQINTFSLDIFEDMQSNSKFLNRAIIFILLKGEEYYLPSLESLKNQFPDNYLIKFSYDIILYKNHIYFEKINFIQQTFKNMSNETIPLRKNLSKEQLTIIQEQEKYFKIFYHTHSIEQSLEYLKTLPLYEYILDYKSWFKLYQLKNK